MFDLWSVHSAGRLSAGCVASLHPNPSHPSTTPPAQVKQRSHICKMRMGPVRHLVGLSWGLEEGGICLGCGRLPRAMVSQGIPAAQAWLCGQQSQPLLCLKSSLFSGKAEVFSSINLLCFHWSYSKGELRSWWTLEIFQEIQHTSNSYHLSTWEA